MTKPSTTGSRAERPSIHKGNSFVCSCREAAPARWDAASLQPGPAPRAAQSAELPAGAETTVVGHISPLLTNTSALVHQCPLTGSPATTQLN